MIQIIVWRFWYESSYPVFQLWRCWRTKNLKHIQWKIIWLPNENTLCWYCLYWVSSVLPKSCQIYSKLSLLYYTEWCFLSMCYDLRVAYLLHYHFEKIGSSTHQDCSSLDWLKEYLPMKQSSFDVCEREWFYCVCTNIFRMVAPGPAQTVSNTAPALVDRVIVRISSVDKIKNVRSRMEPLSVCVKMATHYLERIASQVRP